MTGLANTAPASTRKTSPPAARRGEPASSQRTNKRSSAVADATAKPTLELADAFDQFKASLATYLKPADIQRVEAAYRFADTAHEGQARVSGEAYISHPLAVATTLAGWHLDPQALIAALLHDVMEDTAITKEQIAENFGKVAAELVDGVSKIDRIENQSFEEAQAENFRKMLLAMTRDVRVILIKLADRLHNMQTLDVMRPDKRRRIANETFDIYAPIANRLGLNSLYRELEELSFRHAFPMRYRVLAKAVKQARGNKREVVGKILESIRAALLKAEIEAEVMGREKHVFGIYCKMREKHLTFSQVLDIYGFRVVVSDKTSCYQVLGALHGLYQPVPGKFKDYIAIPKVNGYQSLHTMLIGPFGTPIEVQIRTAGMNHVAESGVASHWMYKDEQTLTQLQKSTHQWLQSLIELQASSTDNTEFLEHVKFDLFPDEVYAFTPQGKILTLPRGSTAVDFAYAVHTDIGNRCISCQINSESVPLRTELRNGDRVEITTASHAHPNPNWLTYVRTGKARAQIRHFMKSRQDDESSTLGERLLTRAIADLGHLPKDIDPVAWARFLHDTGLRGRQEVYAEIGLGLRLAPVVARRLLARDGNLQQDAKAGGSVSIRGNEGVAIKIATCCRPIPGDPIIGLIRKGQGLIVHAHNCATIGKLHGSKTEWVDVNWDPAVSGQYETYIHVVTKEARGVLAKLAAKISESESNIVNVSMNVDGDAMTSLYFTLHVTGRMHLARILRALRSLPDVVRLHRQFETRR